MNYFYKLTKTDVFDYRNLPIVRGKEFGDSVYKTFDNLCVNKKNSDASWLILASLDNLT